MSITILNPGMLTSVQDLGRIGYQQYGVSVSGVMDPRSASIANILVDNDEGEAVLECTMMGPHLRFDAPNIIAITGGDLGATLDGQSIDTYRAGGAGGQRVNRTDSAVRMTHIPTGIVAQCQNERSQVQNREVCLRILKSRLLELREREKEEQMADIKGEMKKIEWGSQIRSYVFQPYTMVKDHRTGYESGNVDDVMDGNLDGFITAYLKMQ